jgi:hypothetical protein
MFTDDRVVGVASVVSAAKSKCVSVDNDLGEGAMDDVVICCSSSMAWET